MKRTARFILFIGICLYSPLRVYSCAIPVFRYALEYWEADNYSLEIFYKKALRTDEQDLLNLLISAQNSQTGANLEINLINIEENLTDAELSNITRLSSDTYPWMVLRYPRVTGMKDILWSGPLTLPNIGQIITSPVRESIARMLVQETTAVWVLLECGDRRKDQAAYDMLTRELNRLEQTLKLPDPELWRDMSKGIPLEEVPAIKFEIIRVSRKDPGETHLINMLINSERDLDEFASEPMVFPVFGRGIALYAIVGKGINEWNIREAAEFITGPCSCQAKLLNPGMDLLISMTWDKVIENITDISITNPLSGIGDFIKREEKAKLLLEEVTRKHIATVREKEPLKEKTGIAAPDYPSTQPGTDNIRENNKESLNIAEEREEWTRKEGNNHSPVFFDTAESVPGKKTLPENTEKQNFLKKLALYIAGLVLIVLVIGIVLYNKSFR